MKINTKNELLAELHRLEDILLKKCLITSTPFTDADEWWAQRMERMDELERLNKN